MRQLLLSSLAMALAACGSTPSFPDAGREPPEILEVIVASPAVEGSVLEVRGLGLEQLGTAPRLNIDEAGARVTVLDALPDAADGRLLFALSADAVTQLGPGTHIVDLVATGGGLDSTPYPLELRIAASLPVDLFEVPGGEVHRNDVGVVNGNGIIGPTEGDLEARFVGVYTFDDTGATRPVDVALPVRPLERNDRERGVVMLSTAIGGLMPGTFEGTVQLVSSLRSGERSESLALDTTLHFNPPELFSLDPMDAALGQLITVRGAGFLGGDEHPDEGTLIRVDGTFTPAGGGTPEPFVGDLVPAWVSGSEVQLVMDAELEGERLISSLFGHPRGAFMGTATPITIKGSEELEGSTVPFGFSIGALRQVIHVRFLPGFYDSLARFGLASAAPEVEEAVRMRMETIYAAWSVDIRFEPPDDFGRQYYSIVEVGGPDPNGFGLFGYDNTPGKDVGNLRLFDAIGGANAETQADGYPGYGGVFVESFLYWSENPGLPGERPLGAPDADPLFDEVFGPVRTQPATRAEARGDGDPERVATVRRAVDALGSIIGETTSHEIGHSLGLAQPYGPPTVYHNDFDGEGCLMDSGGDRPLGERMALSGFAPTMFCYDHPEYLGEILGR